MPHGEGPVGVEGWLQEAPEQKLVAVHRNRARPAAEKIKIPT